MFPLEIRSTLATIENPPISADSYPHVTIPILLDELQGTDSYISCALPHKHRTFRWLKPIIGTTDDLAAEVASTQTKFCIPQVLFLCDAESAGSVLESSNQAFAVVILSEDEKGLKFDCSPTQFIEIHVNGAEGYLDAISCIQSLFTKMLTWENALELVALRKGSLTEMLDASGPIFKNFMFVSDYDFNVVAKTTYIEPPDEFHKNIVEKGYFAQDYLNEKRVRLPEDTFYEREPSELTPFYRISMPIYFDHFQYGSISMACNFTPVSQGLRDKFKIMCDYMTPLCRDIWAKRTTENTPSFFFFEKLIRHEAFDEEYLRTQMETAGLASMDTFKLILIEIPEEADPSTIKHMLNAATKLNGGDVHCFIYETDALVLEFASDSDGQLSHARAISELNEWICDPFGYTCAMSAVFFDICDLDLAYKQTKVALEYTTESSSIVNASPSENHEHIVEFEAAFPFYLLASHDFDTRFMHFAFQSSIVDLINSEDVANGTNHLTILWYYLFSERNATSVAERLHMHRNTVLYNIEKLEKRYDFNLAEKAARDWIQLCFKYFIMQKGKSVMDRLLLPAHN